MTISQPIKCSGEAGRHAILRGDITKKKEKVNHTPLKNSIQELAITFMKF